MAYSSPIPLIDVVVGKRHGRVSKPKGTVYSSDVNSLTSFMGNPWDVIKLPDDSLCVRPYGQNCVTNVFPYTMVKSDWQLNFINVLTGQLMTEWAPGNPVLPINSDAVPIVGSSGTFLELYPHVLETFDAQWRAKKINNNGLHLNQGFYFAAVCRPLNSDEVEGLNSQLANPTQKKGRLKIKWGRQLEFVINKDGSIVINVYSITEDPVNLGTPLSSVNIWPDTLGKLENINPTKTESFIELQVFIVGKYLYIIRDVGFEYVIDLKSFCDKNGKALETTQTIPVDYGKCNYEYIDVSTEIQSSIVENDNPIFVEELNNSDIEVEGYGRKPFILAPLKFPPEIDLVSGMISAGRDFDPTTEPKLHFNWVDNFVSSVNNSNVEGMILATENENTLSAKYSVGFKLIGSIYGGDTELDPWTPADITPNLLGWDTSVGMVPGEDEILTDRMSSTIGTSCIKKYTESNSINIKGMGSMGNSSLVLDTQLIDWNKNEELTKYIVDNLTSAKNSKLTIELANTVDMDTKIRNTQYISEVSISNSEYGETDLIINANDTFKILQRARNIRGLIKYDGFEHTGAVADILSGLRIECVSDPLGKNDVPLPRPVQEKDIWHSPWKFRVGDSYLEILEKIQEFSGWLMYATPDGKIRYRPKPKNPVPEFDNLKYIFADNPTNMYAGITNGTIPYFDALGELIASEDEIIPIRTFNTGLTDEFFSRVLVAGMAAEPGRIIDNWVYNPANPAEIPSYNAGETIVSLHNNPVLEEELGETRTAFYYNKFLGNYAQTNRACGIIARGVMKPRAFITFACLEGEKISDIWVGDVIAVFINPPYFKNFDKAKNFNCLQYYMVTAVEMSVSKSEGINFRISGENLWWREAQ